MTTGHSDGCWPDDLSVTPPSSVGVFEIVLSSTDKNMSLVLLVCRARVSQTMVGCGDSGALWDILAIGQVGRGPERLGASCRHLAGWGALR